MILFNKSNLVVPKFDHFELNFPHPSSSLLPPSRKLVYLPLKQVWWWLVEISMHNAHIIYNKHREENSEAKLTLQEFQLSVIKELIYQYQDEEEMDSFEERLELRQVLYCTVLYCTVLYCTVLYCTVLYRTVLYCTVVYCTVIYCTVLYCTVLYVLYYIVWNYMYCTILHRIILYCTILY